MDRSSSTSGDDRLHGPDAQTPVVPRPAATVILVRDGPAGTLEVYMVRRVPDARFAPDAYVFPGGALHDDDLIAGGAPPIRGLTADAAHCRLAERGGDVPISPAESLALHLAAVRELFEEAGILLAHHADRANGPISPAVCARLAALRPGIQAGGSLVRAALELRLELAPESLVYFSHWITPAVSPRRYDTRFFLAVDRPEQIASHCGLETVAGAWFAPAELLRRAATGGYTLVSVTAEHLRVMAQFGTVAELVAYGRSKPIRTVLSRRGPTGWDLGLNGASW